MTLAKSHSKSDVPKPMRQALGAVVMVGVEGMVEAGGMENDPVAHSTVVCPLTVKVLTPRIAPLQKHSLFVIVVCGNRW